MGIRTRQVPLARERSPSGWPTEVTRRRSSSARAEWSSRVRQAAVRGSASGAGLSFEETTGELRSGDAVTARTVELHGGAPSDDITLLAIAVPEPAGRRPPFDRLAT